MVGIAEVCYAGPEQRRRDDNHSRRRHGDRGDGTSRAGEKKDVSRRDAGTLRERAR